MRGFAAAALTTATLLFADLAYACPGCTSPNEENRQAFVDTTVFLTFLPLIMIGGFLWWLRRRAKQRASVPALEGQ